MREYFVWLFKLITLVLIFFVVVPAVLLAFLAASEQALEGPSLSGKKAVAVVELNGEISNTREVLEELYKQVKNDKVQGIVLRIDSPGGAVGPSQEVYSAVKKLKAQKPIVASMGSMAASGGLYAALSASKIFCSPGTLTGSIGVIMQLPNFRKITEMVGVEMITIKSGQFKDVGNSFRDMTEEEKQLLQSTVLEAYAAFVNAVVEGRGLSRDEVLPFADGRIILGSQAKELKLVDDFGDVYDASRAVYEILGTPLADGEMPELYYPLDKYGELKKILKGASNLGSRLARTVFSQSMELRYELR